MPAWSTRRRVVARRLRHRALHALFEGRSSVDTSSRVHLDELGLDAPGRRGYAPSGWRALSRGLRGIPIGPKDVFVDYGAGLGRVVVQAARRPFGRVIGLELSEDLASRARRYVAGRRRLRCPVEIVTGDATAWELPDDANVLYLNNSFTGDVLETCMGQIVASLNRHPRTAWLIYVNPSEPEQIMRTGCFEEVRYVSKGRRDADDIRIYRTTVKP